MPPLGGNPSDSLGPPVAPSGSKGPNIVLIGLMGAGKTTLGRRLARRIGWALVDTDDEIERRCGASIPLIFEHEGEEGFRQRESRVLGEVLAAGNQVVTTGGGAPIRPENQALIREGGHFVIYLEAEPRHLWARLRHDRSRPLLARSANPRRTLEELYAVRDPIYRGLAHAIIPSTPGSVGLVLSRMVQALETAGLVAAVDLQEEALPEAEGDHCLLQDHPDSDLNTPSGQDSSH